MAKAIGSDQLLELIDCLKSVNDPRVQGRSKHLFIDIIVISICALLCGAEGISDIESFGQAKRDWLKKYIELPFGIPSYDTIARVLSLVDAVEMEKAFFNWVQMIVGERKLKNLSLDGKSSAGTKQGRSQHLLHVVSAYSHELGLSLMEARADEAGGEIKATLACLEVLDLKDVLVTVDAGIGRHEVVEKVLEKKGDYLVPIKANYPQSQDEIYEALNKPKSKVQKKVSTEDQKGRGERRSCELLLVKGASEGFLKQWPKATSIFSITRERTSVDKRLRTNGSDLRYSDEVTYYISSRKLTPDEALTEVRAHWGIENKVHWVLDVAFREDSWGVRAKKLAKNLSLIRKIALNLIRRSSTSGSVRGRMKKAGWDNEFLEKLIFAGGF